MIEIKRIHASTGLYQRVLIVSFLPLNAKLDVNEQKIASPYGLGILVVVYTD